MVVLFHWTGLEEYFVDGALVLTSRAWEFVGRRDFMAGPHFVRIRFSFWRYYCKAYIDGKLAVRDVFPRMKAQRERLKRGKRPGNPVWVNVVFWFLLVYLVLSVSS